MKHDFRSSYVAGMPYEYREYSVLYFTRDEYRVVEFRRVGT